MRELGLRDVQVLWELSDHEMAQAFGVTREVFVDWTEIGVPPERKGDEDLLIRVTQELVANVDRQRIAEVVRKPVVNLGERSLTDLLHGAEFGLLSQAIISAFDLRRVQP